MAAKRGKSRNIVQNIMLRQVRRDTPYHSQFLRSCLLTKYFCIPLCNIEENNEFRSGRHVLLGFTKSGEYLMSYCQQLDFGNVFGIPSYTYTLHWWRFNLIKSLHEVCHISLFPGEFITDELLLIVCHTLNNRRILIHGYSLPHGHGEQSRQCYITFCPSPPCTQCYSLQKHTMADSGSICNESGVVHMKYSLLSPFPMFMPFIQLKMKDTMLVNTVDSVVAVTVSQPPACHKLRPGSAFDSVINPHSQVPLAGCANGVEGNTLTDENTVLSIPKNEEENKLCNVSNTMTGNEKLNICKEPSKLSNLSSFCCKTFCNDSTEAERDQNLPAVIDGASSIDVHVTTLHNTNYRLIQSVEHDTMETQSNGGVRDLPCIQTQVISLDVELYIGKVLDTSVHLNGMYSLLRNYNTQIIDVCDRSQCVILHVVSLIYVQPKAGRIIRRRRCSISFLLSWSISNGDVCTLDVSSLVDQKEKSDEELFEELGSKRVHALRKKCIVPGALWGMQAFSNYTVHTGNSLECIKHPFQPLAIVL